MFDGMEHIKTANAHCISPDIEHEYFDINDITKSEMPDFDKELSVLIDIIKSSLQERKSGHIIVFARETDTINRICDALRICEIKSVPYFYKVDPKARIMA